MFWGYLFFGIIDLASVPMRVEGSDVPYVVLATGWGLLYTFLVMVPLLLWAWDPRAYVFLQQVLVVAAGVLVAGFAARAFGQVLAAAALAATALVSSALGQRPLNPQPGMSLRRAGPCLVSLAAVAVVGAVVFGVAMIRASYAGSPDDVTWGLLHLPMQAAFGLAAAGSAVVGVAAADASMVRWRLSLMPTAVCCVWFGAVSLMYPDHVGSPGSLAGTAFLGWGITFALCGLLVRRRSSRSIQSR